ncbi:hypothetical protein Tcan_02384 [Toxocara canis]|uniref:C2 domain-containing protein n=1 Tax=Toxocara canis TaxID=6265 RepID=A0A0B2UPL0_TOXCA|nr:hypothetical protein Tcan_02384 [Toxocara canis]
MSTYAYMEHDKMTVYVLSARGLKLREFTELKAFVNISLVGPGSCTRKQQTKVKATTTGCCSWRQCCELYVSFSLEACIVHDPRAHFRPWFFS